MSASRPGLERLRLAITWCLLFLLLNGGSLAFSLCKNTCSSSSRSSISSTSSSSSSCRRRGSRSNTVMLLEMISSAQSLLYEDQQKAMARRSALEEGLLANNLKELTAPKLKAKPIKSGSGFGVGKADTTTQTLPQRLAIEQAKVIQRDGVLRINGAMSLPLADRLRDHVLQQQLLAKQITTHNVEASQSFYGVENQRKCRCDLQLSLLRGGFAADHTSHHQEQAAAAVVVVDHQEKWEHVVADALQELLGKDGSLRPIYENLVTLQGEFYELAAVITDPGSDRQQIHPDLPFQSEAPLYVIFLALQDVTEAMGPTTFLLGTHTEQENRIFHDVSQRDDQLSKATGRLSTLNKGDAVLFDARILHCGNGNDSVKGSTRAMFNFSFRNPKVTGDLGYAGSIRPKYCGAMTLQDVSNALEDYANGNPEPFAKYGDGLLHG